MIYISFTELATTKYHQKLYEYILIEIYDDI